MLNLKKVFLSAAFFALAGVMSAAAVSGPSINVGTVSGKAGSAVDLPVMFNPAGSSVSSLQFNLTLPAGVSFLSDKADDLLMKAGKDVLSHKKGNVWTFIIYGPKNQNLIGKGPLLSAHLQIAPGTAAGSLNIPVSGEVYANPKGQAVPPGASSAGVVQVSKP